MYSEQHRQGGALCHGPPLWAVDSCVARGAGGLEPPHWPEKCSKTHVFSAFEADFCSKNENSPPQRDLGAEVVKDLPWFGPAKWNNLLVELTQSWWRPFFFEITCFRPEKSFEIPISAGISVSIWFKSNENLDQGRLKLAQPFKRAPSPFTKSWLRAWPWNNAKMCKKC